MVKVQRCCSVNAELIKLADESKLNTSQELTKALCFKLGHPKDGKFCFCGDVMKE